MKPMTPAAKKALLASVLAAVTLGSPQLLKHIDKWENPHDGRDKHEVYADKLANGLPTACNGITSHVTDEEVIVGDVWSAQKCERVTKQVLEKTQLTLAGCLERPVPQNVFDALTLMAHNVGVGNVCVSVALGLINLGRTDTGCRAIAYTPAGAPNWSFTVKRGADGQRVKTFVQGLHNRRIDEMKLCLKP